MKLYKFNVTNNKEKIKKDIEELVKKDCFVYKNNRTASEKNMAKAVSKINSIVTGRVSADTGSFLMGNRTIEAVRFIDRMNRDMMTFRTRFLLPDPGKFMKTEELLGKRGGQRWWIHFQQQDIYPSLLNLKKAIGNIRTYFSSLTGSEAQIAKTGTTKISQLEKVLLLSESFPTRELSDLTLGKNITYNVIFFNSFLSSSKKSALDAAPDLGGILKKISKKSGGKSITTDNIDQAMAGLRDHRDFYYELLVDLDGKTEEKKVDVKLPGREEKLSFKTVFFKEEIETLVHHIAAKEVRIDGFSLKKNLLKFTIKSFKTREDGEKRFGILKVRIELFSEEGSLVYKTENTLRAAKDTLGLSIPISPKYRGTFKLHITVFDLIANTSNLLIRDIRI